MKKKVILAVLCVLAAVFVGWMIWSNVTFGVTRYTVTSGSLPDAFDGFKIVQISDFHDAEYGKDNVDLVEAVRAEHPDMIAITGDLFDSRRLDIDKSFSLVSRLVGIAPCYYVPGNHEARKIADYLHLKKSLSDLNVIVLHDETAVYEKDGETVQILGLSDPNFYLAGTFIKLGGFQTRLENMNPSGKFSILLSHRPEYFELYVSNAIDLVLSGHSHGGQFRLPFIGGLFAPGQGVFPRYDGGMISQDGTTMVTSRGLGNSAFPIRFNNRPELVVVTLKKSEN